MWCCENAAALARRGERSLDSSASLSLQRAARAAITTDQLTCAQSRRVKGQLRWAYARGQDLKGSKQVKDHHRLATRLAGPRFGLPWCTHDGIPSHSHARSQQRQGTLASVSFWIFPSYSHPSIYTTTPQTPASASPPPLPPLLPTPIPSSSPVACGPMAMKKEKDGCACALVVLEAYLFCFLSTALSAGMEG